MLNHQFAYHVVSNDGCGIHQRLLKLLNVLCHAFIRHIKSFPISGIVTLHCISFFLYSLSISVKKTNLETSPIIAIKTYFSRLPKGKKRKRMGKGRGERDLLYLLSVSLCSSNFLFFLSFICNQLLFLSFKYLSSGIFWKFNSLLKNEWKSRVNKGCDPGISARKCRISLLANCVSSAQSPTPLLWSFLHSKGGKPGGQETACLEMAQKSLERSMRLC